MQPEMEFRVFVKSKRITAISQYHLPLWYSISNRSLRHACRYCYFQYFKELPAMQDAIKEKIVRIWSEISELVPQVSSSGHLPIN